MSIPKVIHYCWFGKGEMPKITEKCIKSWEKFCPGYEIICHNEDNFDLSKNTFIAEAYSDRNFAIVSDYVRAYVLYNYGGIYMDTDVEVLGSFDKFLDHTMFLGFEEGNFVGTCVMGTEKGHELMKTYLSHYDNMAYFNEDGTKVSFDSTHEGKRGVYEFDFEPERFFR